MFSQSAARPLKPATIKIKLHGIMYTGDLVLGNLHFMNKQATCWVSYDQIYFIYCNT